MKILLLAVLSTTFLFACSQEVKYKTAQTEAIERPNPKYPFQAARDKVEGFVRLSFDIDESGKVVNVKVIEESPEKVFSKQAILAVSKWKYEPLIIDNKPVVQKMVSVYLDFKLSES